MVLYLFDALSSMITNSRRPPLASELSVDPEDKSIDFREVGVHMWCQKGPLGWFVSINLNEWVLFSTRHEEETNDGTEPSRMLVSRCIGRIPKDAVIDHRNIWDRLAEGQLIETESVMLLIQSYIRYRLR